MWGDQVCAIAAIGWFTTTRDTHWHTSLKADIYKQRAVKTYTEVSIQLSFDYAEPNLSQNQLAK